MESITNKEDTRFKSGKITLENGLTPHKTRKLPDTPPAGEADPRQLARRPEQLPLKVQEQFVKRKRASHKRSRSLTGFQVEDNGEQELVRKESSEISKLHVIVDKAPASESPSSQLTVQESVTVPKVPRSLPASPVTGRKGAADAFSSSAAAAPEDKEELMKELRWHYKQYIRASKRKKEAATEPCTADTQTSIIRTNRCDKCNKTVAILERVAVENHVFHRSCFLCAICSTWINHFNYCFVPDHDKFYCVQHYQDIESASTGFQENEIRHAMGIGPGVQQQFKFVPVDRVESSEKKTQGGKRRNPSELMKEKIVLLKKRIKQLERKEKKLTQSLNKFKGSESEKKKIWSEWLVVVQEKYSSVRREEELSFKVREMELSNNYSELERELRLITEKEESCKTEEDKKRENKLLQDMLEVVEKREEFMLETKAATQRHIQEAKDLKCKKDEIGISQPDIMKDTSAADKDALQVSQTLKQAPLAAKRHSQFMCPCSLL